MFVSRASAQSVKLFWTINFVLLDLAFTCIILSINITLVLGNIGKGMQYIYILSEYS